MPLHPLHFEGVTFFPLPLRQRRRQIAGLSAAAAAAASHRFPAP